MFVLLHSAYWLVATTSICFLTAELIRRISSIFAGVFLAGGGEEVMVG